MARLSLGERPSTRLRQALGAASLLAAVLFSGMQIGLVSTPQGGISLVGGALPSGPGVLNEGVVGTLPEGIHFPLVWVSMAYTGWFAVLGVAMVMTQTFEQLTDTFVLAMWPFYALSAAAIYTLRKARPGMDRPYKVVGYPYVPAVFIAAAIYLVVNALITDPKWTSITFRSSTTGSRIGASSVVWLM